LTGRAVRRRAELSRVAKFTLPAWCGAGNEPPGYGLTARRLRPPTRRGACG